jgi:AcrR family transcriptional regulator
VQHHPICYAFYRGPQETDLADAPSAPDTAETPEGSRDRGELRRQAFLAAAREVFLEQGFEAASMNEVVRRAGGSLATLYAQFGNKEGLFLAVAQEQRERFVGELTAAANHDLPLEQGLQAIGERFLRTMLHPTHLAFFRIIVGEGRKFPQLFARYLSSGPDQVRAKMAAYLHARGEIEGIVFPDIDATAGYFFDLVRSKLHYRALADETFAPAESELSAHVKRCVRFFLDGALPR